jgi:hypothetical protein
VETIEYHAAAAGLSVDAEGRLAQFDTGFAVVAGRFARAEPRRQARAFLLGLLSDVDTRSCWQLAEQAGDASPHAMQRLLGEAARPPGRDRMQWSSSERATRTYRQRLSGLDRTSGSAASRSVWRCSLT